MKSCDVSRSWANTETPSWLREMEALQAQNNLPVFFVPPASTLPMHLFFIPIVVIRPDKKENLQKLQLRQSSKATNSWDDF